MFKLLCNGVYVMIMNAMSVFNNVGQEGRIKFNRNVIK